MRELSTEIARLTNEMAGLRATPAVPQGFEPAGYLLHWPSFGGVRKIIWNESRVSGDAIGCPVTPVFKQSAATPAPTPAQGEPFGYFRAEPFGWTDCAKDDEGAIALYERPQEAGLTDDERQQVFRAAENRMVREINLSWRTAVVDEVIAALRAKGGK